MSPSPIVRTTLLAALLTLGLVGCSDDPAPTPPATSADGSEQEPSAPTDDASTPDDATAVDGECPLVPQEDVAETLGEGAAPPARGWVDRQTGDTTCTWSVPVSSSSAATGLTVTSMDAAGTVRAFAALPRGSSGLGDEGRTRLAEIVDGLDPAPSAAEGCSAWESASALSPDRTERDGVWTDERQPGLAERCRDGKVLTVNHIAGETSDPALAVSLLEKVEAGSTP